MMKKKNANEEDNLRKLREWLKPTDDEDLKHKVSFGAFSIDPAIDSPMFDPEHYEHDALLKWAVDYFGLTEG
jgi:hypothetical protein